MFRYLNRWILHASQVYPPREFHSFPSGFIFGLIFSHMSVGLSLIVSSLDQPSASPLLPPISCHVMEPSLRNRNNTTLPPIRDQFPDIKFPPREGLGSSGEPRPPVPSSQTQPVRPFLLFSIFELFSLIVFYLSSHNIFPIYLVQHDQCDFAAFGSMSLGQFTTEHPPLSSTKGPLPKYYCLMPTNRKELNVFLVETSVLKDYLLSRTVRSSFDSTYLEAIEEMLDLATKAEMLDLATKAECVLLSGKWTQFADKLEKKQRCGKIPIRSKLWTIQGIWVHASPEEPSSHMETIKSHFRS